MLKNKTRAVRVIVWIVVCFVLSRLSFLAVYVYTCSGNVDSAVSAFNLWDAELYAKIISGILNGTLKECIIDSEMTLCTFFPLNSLAVVGTVKALGGTADIYLVGSIVSSVFFMQSEYVAHMYIMLTRKDFRLSLYYIAFMSFGFCSFYFSVLLTDSLFVLLLSLCFYFLEKEEYLKMGICGALMCATRNVGVLFVFVVLIRCVMRYREKNAETRSFRDFVLTHVKNEKLVLGTFMIPIGLFAYMAWLEYTFGDGLAFAHVQYAWGRAYDQPLKMLLFDLFGFNIRQLATLAMIALIIIFVRDFDRYHEMVIPVFLVLMALLSSTMSMPRFCVGSFTAVLAFCDEFKKRSRLAKAIIAFVVFAIEIGLIREWLNLNECLC